MRKVLFQGFQLPLANKIQKILNEEFKNTTFIKFQMCFFLIVACKMQNPTFVPHGN